MFSSHLRSKYYFFFSKRHQRNKLKVDDVVPKLPEWQRLRQQHNSSADVLVPNLVIRRASVVQGTVGLDANGQKNHAGCLLKSNWQLQSAVCLLFLFSASVQSSSGPSSPDNNNYLRVQAAFGSRRLSENVLNSTGNRRGIIGSSHSSPGSTPGSPNAFGLPIRRHSSAAFAANRRYSSNALLSPSTAAQVTFT